MQPIYEDFQGGLNPLLTPLEEGRARIERTGSIRFVLDNVGSKHYHNAQIYDYANLRRSQYPDKPPLRMIVSARFSHNADQLKGTAGFGFWNEPVKPGVPGFKFPRDIWFFLGGHPTNLALAKDVPGAGWKATTLDTGRLAALLAIPTLPVGVLLMRIRALYARLWPIYQRAIGAAETLIKLDLRDTHTYRLDWLRRKASFFIDDRLILETSRSPRGPLGFVAWMDNSYGIVTPQGHVDFGFTTVPGCQWMELQHLSLEPL